MKSIGRSPFEKRVGTTPSTDGAAKKAAPKPTVERPLPTTTIPKKAAASGRTASTRASFARDLLRRFKAPVAAALLGAATLPGITGGALAAESPDPTAVTERVEVFTRATMTSGPVTAEALYEHHLALRLADIAAQHAQFEPRAPADPIVHRDLLALHTVVQRFDDLVQREGALPPALLADLDHVLTALEAARPGTFSTSLDTALRDLPSTKLDVRAAPARLALRLDLEAVLNASPVDFPDRAQAVLERYTQLMAGADDALARLPDFELTSRVPLTYDGSNVRLVIPPGAQIVHADGQFSVRAPGVLWQDDGVTVVARDATLRLGSELDGIEAGSAAASGDGWQGSLQGFVAGVRRDEGVGVIRADRMDLDLRDRFAHLEGFELLVGSNGDAALTAERLQLGADGFSLDLSDLDVQQTRAGTTASTSSVDYGDATTRVRGDAVDLRFGPTGAQLSAERLAVRSGSTDVALTNAVATLDPSASGFVFAARGDSIRLDTRDGQLEMAGGAVDAQLTPEGALRALTVRGDALAFDGRDFDVTANAGALDLTLSDGIVERMTVTAGAVDFTNDSGALSVRDGALQADFEGGMLRALGAQTGSAQWRGTNGTNIGASQGALQLGFGADGALSTASLAAGALTYADLEQSLDVRGLDVRLVLDDAGRLASATGRGTSATYTRGADTIASSGAFDVSVGAVDGAIANITANAERVTYTRGDEHLSLVGGALRLDVADARVRSATASFDEASYEAAFGRLALSGTSASLVFDVDGRATIEGRAAHLDLRDDAGRLQLDGGTVRGTIAADGSAEALRFGADHLSYRGTAEGDHPLVVDLDAPTALLTQLPSGGQRLDITTGAGSFVVEGHRVALDGVEQLTLQTTPDGFVDAFTADFGGRLDFVDRDGDLSILTRDLGATYDRTGSRLTLDFAQADIALRSEGLRAHIEGASALLDDHRLVVRVDRAELLRDLSEQLEVNVEALELELTRGAQGALQSLKLDLGGLEARVEGMNVMVRTPAGERVRLHVTADDEGRIVKEAFLQIPDGGELRVQRADLDLRLGGQLLRYEQGDDGVYQLRGEGLDIAAATKDAEVRIDGGDAQVRLDPNTGRLVIDEITGTRVDVRTPDANVQLDVERLEGFLVRMTGLEGGATGAALHLVPTTDSSTITAKITGDVAGVPIEVSFSDVRELEALGQISENQVHVYARDPSGQGDLRIGVGPVKLEGSAIELVGRYHPYDAGRMTRSVHQFVTTDGAEVFRGLSFESDGVLRFGTDREGLNAELAVLLPRQYAAPGYRFALSDQPSAAPGVIGSLGYRANDVTLSAFAGLVPGSHATFYVREGTASVGGVELPKRTDLPTTAIGGLRLDLADVDGGALGLVGGAHANAAGFVDSPFVKEETPYGVFGGVEYRRDNWSLSGSGVLDFDTNGSVRGGGVMLRLGVSF